MSMFTSLHSWLSFTFNGDVSIMMVSSPAGIMTWVLIESDPMASNTFTALVAPDRSRILCDEVEAFVTVLAGTKT